jgi:gas vesicle protein
MSDPSIIFSVLAASISIGTILVAFGVIKGKVNQNAEANKAQTEQIEQCASKTELATAIKHSDEMLDLIRKRAEEDRASGEGYYRELYGIINNHAERIKAVETTQKAIDKSLEEIKSDIKTGFADVKSELKEMRKSG